MNYARQKATAMRLIALYGVQVVWRSYIDGAPVDSGKPWLASASTYAEHIVSMVFDAYALRDRRGLMLGEGTVPKGDEIGYMAAQSFTPTLKDVVMRGDEPLTVIDIDTIKPDGSPIIHVIGLAR